MKLISNDANKSMKRKTNKTCQKTSQATELFETLFE